ncbi:pyridoxal-dependent decarboxylase [Actinoplanes sp. NPDC051346]|uniref:pyridoxal phosphate-dependent decarboxylase family protein n=1 Tax=Actinoplanes sp. NPDC051346 TaxID=3155048 RepID=UPI00343AFD7A
MTAPSETGAGGGTAFSAGYGDWEPDEFVANGEAVLAFLSDYFTGIRDLPVSPTVDAKTLSAKIDTEVPQVGEEFTAILKDTQSLIVPYLTHWNHPRFHAYFSNTGSLPGVLADTVSSALNVNAMLWKSAPAASALEKTVLRWMADMLGIASGSDGVLVNGAALATLYALTAARETVVGLDVRERGLTGYGRRLRLYTSDQAHNSVDKAAIVLGIGLENVVHVPADDGYSMRGAALAAAIEADLAAGHQPFAVVATVGTTAVAADDEIDAIADVCRLHSLWLHVDAAYGGFWRVAGGGAEAAADLSRADSVVANPHKVLYAPMEVTALYCRHRDALPNVFRLVPEYLRTSPDDDVVDYMNYSPQLGRSFRALKLWWIIRSFGVQGLARRLRRSIDMARWLRSAAGSDPDWQVPVDSAYPLVCLRYVPRDLRRRYGSEPVPLARIASLNADILDAVNASGSAFLSHAVLRDGYVLRVSIGNIRTEPSDIETLWTQLRTSAAQVWDGQWAHQ